MKTGAASGAICGQVSNALLQDELSASPTNHTTRHPCAHPSWFGNLETAGSWKLKAILAPFLTTTAKYLENGKL